MRSFCCLLILVFLACASASVQAQNPFSSNNASQNTVSKPRVEHTFLVKIALYQQKLKQKMAGLIREVNNGTTLAPLFLILLLAFGYGLVHAAGPGHGKAIAMSYMASRKPSLSDGLLLGMLIAFIHGFSGIACVLGLHFLLNTSISGTMDSVSKITQLISFSLIALLGLTILIKNGWDLVIQGKNKAMPGNDNQTKNTKKGLVPWALAVGLVPCPGVVMIMLFCLSMDVLLLGLALAVCMSLGMATTISLVVAAVILGKAGVLNALSQQYTEKIEMIVGMISGVAIAVLGSLFLLSTTYLSLH